MDMYISDSTAHCVAEAEAHVCPSMKGQFGARKANARLVGAKADSGLEVGLSDD